MTTETIADVVSAICVRAGLTAGQIDVTSLASITTPVNAMVIGQVSSARTVLEMLSGAYGFDLVLSDKIYFVARGGASAVTLTYDDIGASPAGDDVADPLPLTQANELEVPSQVALTYNDIDSDYQTDTQLSDRLITSMESTSAVSLPLGFTASEAKAIVDKLLFDSAWRLRTSISLPISYTRLEPTDVITVTASDGSTYRLRITRRKEERGVLTFDGVIDDATILTQAGTTSTGVGAQSTVAALPTTTLELLDIPMLTDAEDTPGIYCAVMGSNAAWTLAALYESVDNVTYVINDTITDQAAIGTCSTTLGDWTDWGVFDTKNSVTVSVGSIQTLSSYSRDTILTGAAPGYLVGSELLYAMTATLVSPGVYTLSNLLRGRKGTEWAVATHTASERFVELWIEGVRFLPLQAGSLGALRYYKAPSAGQVLADVTAETITPLANNLKPYSPVDARVDRSAGVNSDHIVTWKRRTRMSCRLTGALAISAPLGEASESYVIEFYTSSANAIAGTPVAGSVTATAQTYTYTDALRTTHGTSDSVLYMRIYQVSATVGNGQPLITSA